MHTLEFNVHKATKVPGKGFKMQEDAMNPEEYMITFRAWRDEVLTAKRRKEKGIAIKRTKKIPAARKRRS